MSSRPWRWYGFLFASGALGRKLENVQARIGGWREIEARTFFPNGPSAAGDAVRYKRDLGACLSRRDLRQLFVKSLEAPTTEDDHGIPVQVSYGIFGKARAFWSIVNAGTVIGHAPEDHAELKFADEIGQYLTGANLTPG